MCRKLFLLISVLLLSGLVGAASAALEASNPDPPNNDWCVPLESTLTWVSGEGAASHNVYFGDDYTAVTNGSGSTFQGNFTVDHNYFEPGPLKKAKTYYWRVEEVGDPTVQGETWGFTTTTNFCLKVDLAQVECPNSEIIRPPTAKPGWWHWATGRWADMYSHDASWACEQFPCPNGIDDTGVTAAMSLIREGDGGLKVSGLTMASLAGGSCPYPRGLGAFGGPLAGIYYDGFDPKPGPICNSWFTCVDWPEIEWGSIMLALHDVPPGAYVMYSYHNQFSAYRWLDLGSGTSVPNDGSDIDPPMPVIRAMSVKDFRNLPYASADSFQKLTKVSWDPGPWPEGVTSLQDACSVPIQNVLSDDELNPSEIKFMTNGSPVIVMYKSGSGHIDPVRTGRIGGRGILNAFVLMLMALDNAYAPSPGNGAENVQPDVTLQWVAGEKAGWHDVYFGTNRDDVLSESTTVFVGRQPVGDTDYDPPGLLLYDKTYYWKVNEVNESDANSPWTGPVWSFTTYRAKAAVLSPADGTKDLPKEGVQLSWSAGYVAESHDVYLGTNLNDVENATTSSPQYKGNQIPTTYQTLPLVIGQTYYWRIDERSSTVAPYYWKGDVWEFSVENFLVIDDFESYDEISIYNTWIDGGFVNNGAFIALGKASDSDPVHWGQQSLEYLYDNTGSWTTPPLPYYSEAYRAISNPSDWTSFGVKILSLWFYGDPLNAEVTDNDGMYVGVEDGRGIVSYAEARYADTNDMNDIEVAEWHQWNIELQDLADAGVILTDVKKLYIGFGDRGAPAVGTLGVVYFDDIRLYVPAQVEVLCYEGQPDVAQWDLVGQPECWCYPRQCLGDADGLPYGKNNYWVAIPDLTILKAAWNKPKEQLVGNEICADSDHLPYGKNNYRVAIPDLTILKANWNIPNGPDPNCFAGY